MTTLDVTESTALLAMQEAHDLKLWAKVTSVGDSWVEAKGELPAVAATLYAEALMVQGRIQEAVDWSGKAAQALKASPSVAGLAALMTLGRALCRAGSWRDAERVLTMVTRLHVENPEATEKQGHILLAISKKWRKGWSMHEARLREEGRVFPANMRPWDGRERVPVTVLHEQGLGDAVLCARWLGEVMDRTGHPVTWLGPKPLHRWIGALPGVLIGDIDAVAALPDAGAGLFAFSLPHVLRCDSPDDVPLPVAPNELLVAHHTTRSISEPLTVGLCWKGAATGWHDFERSYMAAQFAPLWETHPDLRFVNLCHDAEVPEGAPFAKRVFGDVYNTGEVIGDCDMVITVDTAVAHVAGSLGIPTFVLVPTVADWRWSWPHGKDTPWYPSVSVIRRPNAYSDQALLTVQSLLAQLVDHSRTVLT